MIYRRVLFAVIGVLVTGPSAWGSLQAHVTVTQTGYDFNYTLYNDEPNTSDNFLNIFHLGVYAPVAVTSTPAGWDFFTDNLTYVDWFSTDATPPYPHDVAPGSSLSGFDIQTTVSTTSLESYAVVSWDHAADAPGPSMVDVVLAPSGPAAPIPEPSSIVIWLAITAVGGVCVLRKRHRNAGGGKEQRVSA